jgi:hypothetical protein
MNTLQKIGQRNRIRQLIEQSNRRPNGLYWGSGETEAHIQMKLEICKWLKKQGKEFMTEAKLITGQRCDIINCDDAVIYEVVESESEESIEKKRKDYPLEIIVVKANQPFNEKLIL